MFQHSSISTSQLYRGFKQLDETAFRSMVHFYEKNELQIKQLELHEYFDILMSYTNALLESEDYREHLEVSDFVIALSMEENIIIHDGEDVLQKMLYQKARSYFHLREYKKAVFMLSEQLKINPFDDVSISFLRKCLWSDFPAYIQKVKAVSMIGFLTCAFVIAVEMVAIRTLFPEYASKFELTRNILFTAAIGNLVLAYCIHGFKVLKKAKFITSKAKMKFLYGE